MSYKLKSKEHSLNEDTVLNFIVFLLELRNIANTKTAVE